MRCTAYGIKIYFTHEPMFEVIFRDLECDSMEALKAQINALVPGYSDHVGFLVERHGCQPIVLNRHEVRNLTGK